MRKYRLQHANIQDLLRFTKRDANGCFIWQKNLDKDGYPYLWIDSHSTRAHSYVCALINGPRPEKAVTLHSCDNPSCINPDHLSWGSQRQNILDKFARGRANLPTGSNHASAKLTERIVSHMRTAHYGQGQSINSLAKQYCVSYGTAYEAVKGTTWKNVGGLP
jgi:hypothetical protein